MPKKMSVVRQTYGPTLGRCRSCGHTAHSGRCQIILDPRKPGVVCGCTG